MDAWNARAYTIAGLPDWADSGHDLFDITARIPADQTPTIDDIRRVLQTLLADRFHLKSNAKQNHCRSTTSSSRINRN
jgi:uncharacterized protein (TIGR03435 family)